MTYTPVKPTFTFEEYLNYNDGSDRRYELVEGELVKMTDASPQHSDLIDFLADTFKVATKRLGRDLKVKQSDVGVRTGLRRVRNPDLSVIEGKLWREWRGKSKSSKLEFPPLLVVEIVSPGTENRERDYQEKVQEYEGMGIPEYWIVDPIEEQVTVLVLEGGKYQHQSYQGETPIFSPLFEELFLTPAQIFAV